MNNDVALQRLFEQKSGFQPNPKTLESKEEEKYFKKCPHYFGYLNIHIKYTISIPEECLICSKVADCILFPLANINAHPCVKLKEETGNEISQLAPIL